MDNTKRVNMVLDYIEQQLCHELDEEAVSRIACCSFQQFLRIFSYMTGISLHEYIRRRKLSAMGMIRIQDFHGHLKCTIMRLPRK